jgi:hypothetical protein
MPSNKVIVGNENICGDLNDYKEYPRAGTTL